MPSSFVDEDGSDGSTERSDSESNSEEENEYEMQRKARIASNMARFESVQKAADALWVFVWSTKP